MTPRRSGGRARQAVHLIFSENLNDSASIRELLLAVRPELRVEARPRPTSLQRGAGRPAVSRWMSTIKDVVEVTERRGQPVSSVLVHRDADAHDPSGLAHAELAQQISPLARAHPVVPVQMLEAWWFLFPEAVEAVRPTLWRGKLPRRPRDVETINRPYEELVRLTRGSSEYAKADAPSVATKVRELQLTPRGRSASYARLIDLAARLKQ